MHRLEKQFLKLVQRVSLRNVTMGRPRQNMVGRSCRSSIGYRNELTWRYGLRVRHPHGFQSDSQTREGIVTLLIRCPVERSQSEGVSTGEQVTFFESQN